MFAANLFVTNMFVMLGDMTEPSDPPRSRRERPAKPALTRSGIVSAAVEITRTEGLQKVTMRRLAQQLDTGPASLYVYVRDVAELHAAVLDELLASVDLGPVRADGDWQERLQQVLASYTVVLFGYPGLAQSALVARPSGQHYLTLIEALLALLDEGGVPGGQAAWGVDLLLHYATASAAEQTARDRSASADEDWDALARAVRDIPAHSHPHLARQSDELLSGDPESRMSWAFQILITGIAHIPRPATSDSADGPR